MTKRSKLSSNFLTEKTLNFVPVFCVVDRIRNYRDISHKPRLKWTEISAIEIQIPHCFYLI